MKYLYHIAHIPSSATKKKRRNDLFLICILYHKQHNQQDSPQSQSAQPSLLFGRILGGAAFGEQGAERIGIARTYCVTVSG